VHLTPGWKSKDGLTMGLLNLLRLQGRPTPGRLPA
jgi:hypothetical protein